jgi:NAD(P)-dependent dehydrogenase (short-subunit alcohol dehydrogenase family)
MTVMEQFRLDGDVALVTGAAGGIGGALSEAVAEAGADVAIVDVNEDGLEEHAAHLEAETDASVESIVADVSDEDANERMVERTVQALGGLDVAFANAGIGLRGGSPAEYDMDDWDELMSINFRGAFLTDRAAAGYMVDNGGGRIVNTASILGVNGTMIEGLSAYTAAKGGVVQITRQLAGELGRHGVRVNAIAPGFIETAMTEEGLAGNTDAFAQQIPLGRIGQPEDLKGIAVYLASEASPYTTGEIVLVDGGLNAV